MNTQQVENRVLIMWCLLNYLNVSVLLIFIKKKTLSNVYSQHNVCLHNIISLTQHNVYSHNIFLLIQDKVPSYGQLHFYYSNYMNDESNDESIKRLQSSVNANIFFKFMLLQYGCEINEDLDLNVKEYELYKDSMRLGNNDDKEEVVEFNCEDQMNNFLPYYYKTTSNFSDKNFFLT